MYRTTVKWKIVGLLAVMALVLAACASDDADGATTTTAAAATTTTAAAATTTTAAGETTTTGADPLEAARAVTWRFGINSVGEHTSDGSLRSFEIDQFAQALGARYMIEDGWDIEVTFVESGGDLVNILIAGQLDVVASTITPAIAAVLAGVKTRSFYAGAGPVYVMAARVDMEGPDDFDGKRVGIHGAISTGALLTKSYLGTADGDVEPQYLIIEGSQNRLLALIADEIDASTLALGEDEVLMEEAPGKFHIIYNYAEESDLILDTISYLEPLTDDKQAFLVELFRKTQEAKEFINSASTEELGAVLTEMDVLEAENIQAFIDNGVWTPERFLTADAVDATVATMADVGLIECPCPSGAEIVDESIRELAGY